MQVPKRRSEQERRAREHVDHHLTREAIEQLQRERARLIAHVPKLADETQRMREMGDLSENAGYQTAKAQLTRANFRILEIEEQLKYAVPIARGVSSSGRVQIGSTVTIARDGVERTYEILGSEEVNPSRGRISHHSPLGVALMGRKVGDAVTVTVNGKTTTYTILAVQ
ncbi:MAG: transcription elongation factor GreA [bacterium]|nr:transcription elongation factor GreA [bacterium]